MASMSAYINVDDSTASDSEGVVVLVPPDIVDGPLLTSDGEDVTKTNPSQSSTNSAGLDDTDAPARTSNTTSVTDTGTTGTTVIDTDGVKSVASINTKTDENTRDNLTGAGNQDDDKDTGDESCDTRSSDLSRPSIAIQDKSTPKKRPMAENKVYWTDESDDMLDPLVSKRRKMEVSAKRKQTERNTVKITDRKAKQSNDRSQSTRKDPQQSKNSDIKKSRLASPLLAGPTLGGRPVPDYLYARRTAFDRDLKILKGAGLRLPPDYQDFYPPLNPLHRDQPTRDPNDPTKFDTERKGDNSQILLKPCLATRPDFGPTVKPSRPYRDIYLEDSGSVIPAPVAQYLRDYQVTGVRFLQRLFAYQRGGILGDDMGLGKTVQVAAFLTTAFGKTGDERDNQRMRLLRRATSGTAGSASSLWYPRVMIVCPGSLIQNWKQELERWGWWHVDLYHGPYKADVMSTARTGMLEVMITTYETYKINCSLVNTVEWDIVVADECHRLKDGSSEITRAMNQVNALCRIGLTGTAIQNKYDELWTLLDWTSPGYFGTHAEWQHAITRPLTVGQSHDATLLELSVARKTAKKLVQNLLPGVFLRRMKTLIADQLPRKTDRVVFCPLTSLQSEAYQRFLGSDDVSALRHLHEPCECGAKTKKSKTPNAKTSANQSKTEKPKKRGWCCGKLLSTEKPWQSFVFPAMITLQQLSNHVALMLPSAGDHTEKRQSQMKTLQKCFPEEWQEMYDSRDSMINLSRPEFCGKWKILKKLLRFWRENRDKVLVFSHSVKLLHILRYLFHSTSYSFSYLDGSLAYEERQKVVDRFNSDPEQFVFLISTKAGGVGLNITSANKVVIFDPHWNPSYDLQAQDRAYRIGQTRDVDVFRLISAGTIEEIVYARQIYKQQQANIGYSASSERRYFKGVQDDDGRKGEIFGLENIFSYHGETSVLQQIVNKTNIAEAKAGVDMTELDAKAGDNFGGDDDIDNDATKRGQTLHAPTSALEEEEAGRGVSHMAKLFIDEEGGDTSKEGKLAKASQEHRHKSDAIQAILASAGVEYAHDNSDVVGSSRIEEQLSRKAELEAERQSRGDIVLDSSTAMKANISGSVGIGPAATPGISPDIVHDVTPNSSKQKSSSIAPNCKLFASDSEDLADDESSDDDLSWGSSHGKPSIVLDSAAVESPVGSKDTHRQHHSPYGHKPVSYKFNPPESVMIRQFCTMARDFGFATTTDFAFVVEGWSSTQRSRVLDLFYRRRRDLLQGKKSGEVAKPDRDDVENTSDITASDASVVASVATVSDVDEEPTVDGQLTASEGEEDISGAHASKNEVRGPANNDTRKGDQTTVIPGSDRPSLARSHSSPDLGQPSSTQKTLTSGSQPLQSVSWKVSTTKGNASQENGFYESDDEL